MAKARANAKSGKAAKEAPPSAEATAEELTNEVLRRNNARLEKALSARQSGEAMLVDTVRSLWEDSPPAVFKTPLAQPDRRKGVLEEERAVLHLSDVHYGAKYPGYNRAVCEERLAEVVRRTASIVSHRRQGARIECLTLLLGGDMVEGENIFAHQPHQIDCDLFEQACRGGPVAMLRTIAGLLEIFPKVRIVCVPGNHGRNGPRKNPSSPGTNWDRVFYELLESMLLGSKLFPNKAELASRVQIVQTDTFYAVANVWRWGLLLVHGHEIRGGHGGFPFYGVGKKMSGWADQAVIPTPWDYLFFGHFHSMFNGMQGSRRWYANGSLCSGSVWVQQEMANSSVPAQRLCFFNEGRGLISDNELRLVDGVPVRDRHLAYTPLEMAA